jgi:hypothetical protein
MLNVIKNLFQKKPAAKVIYFSARELKKVSAAYLIRIMI